MKAGKPFKATIDVKYYRGTIELAPNFRVYLIVSYEGVVKLYIYALDFEFSYFVKENSPIAKPTASTKRSKHLAEDL